MKIQDYSVAMNSQYYKVEMEQTEATISSSDTDFTNTQSVEEVHVDEKLKDDAYNELSVSLAASLLQNINQSSSDTIPTDKLSIESTYVESQELNFQTKAFIITDSKEIELSIDVSMSRSFASNISLDLERAKLQDPLVLELNGSMPQLSSKTFSFDLDSDGQSNQISLLKEGSAFLALDKNENSKIDNGNELFGTQSGDGFGDLSLYDEDENGWIDENDTIFDKLRVWQKTEGEDRLLGLGEVGVGAIFLGSNNTPFELKSDTNELLGQMRSSGFFLKENGTSGVISQIDFALKPEAKENLEKLEELNKVFEAHKLSDAYAINEDNESKENSRMEQLQELVKSLENKLKKAEDEDKPALQAQIGAVYAQMIALIEEEMR
ncbi:MAG: hypothetical protein U9N42_04895 [Campylobacterota bacterium]|nr:hypothetical protein [Campylobacterota bacterium]